MAVVRKSALIDPLTLMVIGFVKSDGRNPYARACSNYDGVIEIGMFWNAEKDKFERIIP